jgi:2-keto-4-pentenoate hydratase/2-oxohepta-3-ene-1,7-dioic acid hydratase in catechol pathway
MKIMFFDDFRLGVLRGDEVIDVTDVVQDIPHLAPQDLIRGLIARFEDYRAALKAAAAKRKGVPLASVTIRPPLPRPNNIVCMAVNYMEDGTLAEAPAINAFHKASVGVIGPKGTMVLPDVPGKIFEGEAEVAVVIGKTATNVSRENAMDHIFGYTCFIDGSVRGLPPEGNVFFQMKSRDTFAAMGPMIVTADEIADPHNLRITLRNNGQVMQDFNTSDMAHPIDRCIEWVSSIHTLEPGDLLSTGTNHRGLNPFMDGDRIELEVEKVGKLEISIRDDLKRVWNRKTRLQHTLEGGTGQYTQQIGGKYAPPQKMVS